MNFKPSLTVGYDKKGKAHVLLIGDAEETLELFKKERDLKNYAKVAWFRKMKPDKNKWTDRPNNVMKSVDNSKYDGDAGRLLLEKEESEAASIGESKESTAPAKRGKNK